MAMKKEYWVLLAIFALTLAARLYFAFQTPYFSPDSYFNIRQIEHIKNTGVPLFNDDLSYGGRTYIFLPVFHYVMAFFGLIMPMAAALKIMPNIFASSLVLIVFFLSKRISKNSNAALFAAFVSGFIPVFFSETINSVSVYSLIIPLVFLLVFYFVKIKDDKGYAVYFVFVFFVLSLTHPSAFIVILGLLFYLVFVKSEEMSIMRARVELVLFSTFFLIWLQSVFYKNAFIIYGPAVVWQNIPKEILNQHFTELNVLEAIYNIGIIPFVFGIFTIYRYAFREKHRSIYLLIGFAASIGILLWLQLIMLKTGLMFLGVILALLFAQFYELFFTYIENTKIHRFKNYFVVLFIIIFISTSFIPSLGYAKDVLDETPAQEEISALLWIKENTENNSVVLSSLEEGHLITAVAERKNVMDTNFLLVKYVEQRYRDINEIYTTNYKTDAIGLLNKYDARYVYFSERARKTFGINSLKFIDDKCFERAYHNKKVTVYKSLCRLEG